MRISGQLVAGPGSNAVSATVVTDGRLVGRIERRSPGPGAEPFILPGLLDSHTHPLETGLCRLFPDLAGATRVADVIERLRDCSRSNPGATTLFGFNLDPDAMQERRYPSVSELDRVADGRPLLVYRVDGHSAAVNSHGLALLTDQCALPADGVLSGAAYEAASRRFKHRLAPDQIRLALGVAGREAAAQGVVALGAFVGDDEMSSEQWEVLTSGLELLPVKAVPYLQTWQTHWATRFGLEQIGGCLLIDGSFGSHTAALSLAYDDQPDNCGQLYVTDERLAQFYCRAEELGLQTAVHAIGDRAVNQVLRCQESAGLNAGRHRIEHAELLNPELVERAARAGATLGVQPVFEATWGGPDRMYAQRLGSRWQRTNPYRDLLDQGVYLAGGSDSPITPINPVAGIAAAIRHPNHRQRLNGDEALALFTTGAARALQLDSTHGTVEAGRAADLVLLTADPRTSPQAQVVATVCAGRCIYSDHELASGIRLD